MDTIIPDTIPALANYQRADNALALDPMHPPKINLSGMFERYLLQKAISVFEWRLPKTWNRDYFLYVLYCFGHLAIVNTDKFGTIPQACGLMGYNVFYQPTNAIITNPLLTGILQPRIGKECVLLKLQPDYGGILDIVQYYANMMAQAASSAAVSLNNSKAAMIFFARNKAAAEAYKKAFDALSNGQPAIVLDKGLINDDGSPAWDLETRDPKDSYIVGDILRDMRKIEAMYDTDIGIPNANTDKRERLITDEVNANNVETYSKCALWLEELQAACEQARGMFGIELSVDWREIRAPEMDGGDIDGTV